MEFETIPTEKGVTAQLIIIGLIVLAALGVAIGVFIWLLQYEYFRLALVFSPLIALASWLTGYWVSRLDSYPRQCKCSYQYNYFWTEWYHKRRCLAFTLNGK